MIEVKNKVYVALETNGQIYDPPGWMEEIIIIDQFGQRYGWEFVSKALAIQELNIEQIAGLKGILEGERKKEHMDELRRRL